VVVLCVSPTGSQVEQTVSTLRFGLNVKKICNKVKSNSYETKNFEALQKLVSDYEVRIKHLEIEKLKEKNQSEELIEMIKRQAQHKKELTDKILSLENRVPTEVREELRETLLERSHEKEGLARILSQSSETVDHLKPVIEGQEREAECRQLRRANNHFMYKISKLRSQAAAKAKGLQGIEGLVRDLFSDQRAILSLEDVTLQKIKERCVVAVQKIDEQLISRKIQRRLNGVLRESVVQTVEEPCEDNLGLGKRGSRHGLLCPQSIKMIMDKSCLEGPRLYEDSLLPGILARYLTEEQQAAKIQPQCTGEAIAQPPEEQTDTSDIIEVEDNSEEEEVEVVYPRAKELVFNLGHLRNYIYRPQRAPPAQPNQAYEGNRAGELRRSSLMQTRNAILVDADCEGGLPAKSGMEEDRSVGSESNRGNIFQTGLSAERQPLLELSNKRSDHLKFASPKSQGTSLYFFTSKKNDFEFSFDRSAMLVEKNLELQYSRGKAGHQSLGKEN
jgi:ribosomal protein S18